MKKRTGILMFVLVISLLFTCQFKFFDEEGNEWGFNIVEIAKADAPPPPTDPEPPEPEPPEPPDTFEGCEDCDPLLELCCVDGNKGECYTQGIEGCCDGEVYNDETHECCNGKIIYERSTQKCCSDTYGNPYLCPKNKECCNGSCCNKVWTKETHPAINESCPPVCDSAGCDGIKPEVIPSFESCLNVGVGLGEHCDCHQSMQVVGYRYTCVEEWDWGRMIWCLAQGAWCAAECYLFQDPAGCANCLAGTSDCCDSSPCRLCDFLISCEPTNPQEIRKNVFIDFGGC